MPVAERWRSDPFLFALVAIGLLLRLFAAARPLLQIDDLAIPDDAYLSLTLARSIAHGWGPLYGLAPTNGFQPLYVFLMAPAFVLIPHDAFAPVRIAQLLLVACDLLALVVLYRMIARLSRSRAVPRLIALAWAINPYVILTSLNALETSLSFLLMILVVARLHRLESASGAARTREALGFGALVGLAALARFDNLLLAAALGGVLLARRVRARVALVPSLRTFALVGLGAGLAVLPWLAYSWYWTRDLVPVSGRAVRYMCLSSVHHAPTLSNLYLPMLRKAIEVTIRRNPVYLTLIAGLYAVLAMLGRGALREAHAPRLERDAALLFGVLLFIAYTGVIFGPWHFARYLFPLILVFSLHAGRLLDVALDHVRAGVPRRALIAGLTWMIVLGSVMQPSFRRLSSRQVPGAWGYMRIGLWAREHIPKGTVCGGAQSGALGYFADSLTVVNLDGVVNRAYYDAMRAGRAIDYIRAAHVRLLVWQDDIEFIARESRGARPDDVMLLGTVPGIRTLGEPWTEYRVRP